MSLGNPKSIVGQILLFNYLHNLLLMISRYNWFLGIAFLTAAFGALIPPVYMAIAFFCSLGLMLSIAKDRSISTYSYQIEGGVKNTIILASLIAMCLIVPQVETNMANFRSPTDSLGDRSLIFAQASR